MATESAARPASAIASAASGTTPGGGCPSARRASSRAAPARLAALYPVYYDSLPTSVPVIQNFPSVSTAVIMIVFIMMAVGLNIVVGYCGLLDLGYVAFYAVGAYTAGWLASGHFQQVKIHIGSAGISTELRGIHINIWVVLLIAGCLTGLAGILIGLPTLRLRGTTWRS